MGQFAPRGTPFPPMEELPSTTYMSACEVLTWIAYRRPISKWLFYGPLEWANASTFAELAQALHEQVPQPRPPDNPMSAAETELLTALRDNRLRAFDDQTPGMPVIDRDVFSHSVAVSCRGFLEADSQSFCDWKRGREVLGRRSIAVAFLTAAVREAFPPRDSDKTDGYARAAFFIKEQLAASKRKLKRNETIRECVRTLSVTNEVATSAFLSLVPRSRRLGRGEKG